MRFQFGKDPSRSIQKLRHIDVDPRNEAANIQAESGTSKAEVEKETRAITTKLSVMGMKAGILAMTDTEIIDQKGQIIQVRTSQEVETTIRKCQWTKGAATHENVPGHVLQLQVNIGQTKSVKSMKKLKQKRISRAGKVVRI